MAKTVFYYCLIHLSCVHIYIILYKYGFQGADVTAYLMILTSNMSSLAWLYRDGDPALKDDDLTPG